MKLDAQIPTVDLVQIHRKEFGFQIVGNRESLFNTDQDHNPFLPHRIKFYSILFILEGEGYHYIDFKKYRYEKGSVIFISKEQVHAFEMNLKREAYFLLFTEEFLSKGNTSSNLMKSLSLYNYHLYPPVYQLEEKELSVFHNLVKKIKIEFDSPEDSLSEEIIHSSLRIFLCMAERIRKRNQSLAPKSKYHEEYLRFQTLLKGHILESRKVNYYSEKMLISSKKLNRITQEILGKTAKQYINDFLIIEIKRLLMNTSYSIKEIAFETGFDQTTNFVKYFKKYTGLNPGEFRKQILVD